MPILIAELIAITIGVVYWKKTSVWFRLAVVQVTVVLCVEVTGKVLTVFDLGSNSWLFNIYAIVETVFLIWLFKELSGKKRAKITANFALIILVLWWGITALSNGILAFMNWYLIAMALLAIILFISVLIGKSVFSEKKIYAQPVFLMCVAIIIYYASVIPLFGVLNHLIEVDRKLARNLFYINKGAALVRYALTAAALYLHGRNSGENAYQ